MARVVAGELAYVEENEEDAFQKPKFGDVRAEKMSNNHETNHNGTTPVASAPTTVSPQRVSERDDSSAVNASLLIYVAILALMTGMWQPLLALVLVGGLIKAYYGGRAPRIRFAPI